jgi:pimeloyl-ACP methyl ester carboxylesterase
VSSIVTDRGIVHYEAYGRGEPVILLHGWINSWDVWRDTMIAIPEFGRYKVYALDFWGFGDSAKQKTPPFKIQSYVDMVNQFMGIMGIVQAPIFGHSMGGTVALSLTLKAPERVKKVAIVGSPINGNSLNIFPKLSGIGWIARLAWRVSAIKWLVMWMVLAGDSPKVREMIFRDVDRANIESFFRSIGDLHRTDLRGQMYKVTIPTLGVFGTHDNIVNPNQSKLLGKGVPQARVEMLNASRHFLMLDEPKRFINIVQDFLASTD